jgi:Sulfotransferase domain
MPADVVRIFQIGFNKCGTRTLASFFEANGLRCAHWDSGRLAKAMFRNLAAGHSLIEGYRGFQVFTDMEFTPGDGSAPLQAFKLYPQLAAEFPNAVFILNTRNREAWIQSRLGHRSGRDNAYLEKWKRIYNLATAEAVAARWREEWDRHHREVMAFFAESPYRFVVFDIEQDSPDRLVRALPEYALDIREYKRRGSTKRVATEAT